MVAWLIGVAVFMLLWAAVWRANPRVAYGAVWGFVIALLVYWLFSSQLTAFVTGMNEIPIWLPPLPIILVVIALFYFGFKTWLNADKLPPPRVPEDEHHGHEHH